MGWAKYFLLGVLGIGLMSEPGSCAQETVPPTTLSTHPTLRLGERLSNEQAAALAKLALAGLNREFPNKPSTVMANEQAVQRPRAMFPAFYGCFDWHSAVHGHWLLVRILRQYPQVSNAAEIRQQLAAHLTAENLAQEAAFFADDTHKSFERMYGWAWYLRLVQELHESNDPEMQQWRAHCRPLEEVLVRRIEAYLPLLTYPIRTGEHPDTGFALGQILDYARSVNNASLTELVIRRGGEFYSTDRNYPFHYEPSGHDFFSSGLNEADFMRRIMPAQEFAKWLDDFLGPWPNSKQVTFVTPVVVSDVTDGKLVHLAGLDLNRAWCLQGIARGLPENDPRRAALLESAQAHLDVGMSYVFSGHYEGEHWLATFALFALTQ